MFDSGMTALDLIEQIESEADISAGVPQESFVRWINAVEQLLYTEIIKEQAEVQITNVKSPVPLTSLTHLDGASPIRYEDIHAVFRDDTQLIKSTLLSGAIFPDSYYKAENELGLHLAELPKKIRIFYHVRPALKKVGSLSVQNVRVPPEFLELVAAKLRGEAYKSVNEDGLAAKWLNDYNVLLETFKTWIAAKEPSFGM